MGRGRQKAKQMKVARRLKYSVHETDLDALQRELSGVPEDPDPGTLDSDVSYDVDDDDYLAPAGAPRGSDSSSDDDWDEGSWVNPEAR